MPFAYSLDTIAQSLQEHFETIVPSLLRTDEAHKKLWKRTTGWDWTKNSVTRRNEKFWDGTGRDEKFWLGRNKTFWSGLDH